MPTPHEFGDATKEYEYPIVQSKYTLPTSFCQATCTVVWKIFVVTNFSWVDETTKIY